MPSWRGAQLKHRENFTLNLAIHVGLQILKADNGAVIKVSS
jgi:hypothetical protein